MKESKSTMSKSGPEDIGLFERSTLRSCTPGARVIQLGHNSPFHASCERTPSFPHSFVFFVPFVVNSLSEGKSHDHHSSH